MKDKKKIIVPLLLAGVTATGIVANVVDQKQQQIQVSASETITDVKGAEIKVEAFKNSGYKINTEMELPKTTVTDGLKAGEKLVYTVKKDKKEYTIEKNAEDKYLFTPKYQGYYNLTIAVKNENGITTAVKNLSFFVEKEEATIALPVNSEYVIPAKIPASLDGLKIPAPTVTVVDENGEDIKKTAKELGNKFVCYLSTPSEDVMLTLDAEGKYYAVDKTKLSETGTYQIVYEYRSVNETNESLFSVISRLESNFQVVKADSYVTSDIKLKMSLQSSMPTSGNVGTDITIPKVKVVDSNTSSTDAVNAHVEVIIKKNGQKVNLNVDYDKYSFKPTEIGTYSITYVATIPVFGENCKCEVTPADTIVVSDKQAPQVIPTYKYDFDAEGEITRVYDSTEGTPVTDRESAEKLLVNRRVDIPSVAKLEKVGETKSVKITIPAAYATDNFYTFKGKDNDEIKIVRSYRSSTGAVTTVETEPNKPAEIEFKTKGNAEIRYQATDKAGNTLGEIVYDIVIYDTDEDLTKGTTKVNLNIGTSQVSDQEKVLTFAKPTATDTYDKNIEVKTFYQVGTNAPVELTKTNDDGKYQIKISDIGESATEFKIYAEAYLDEIKGVREASSGTNVVKSTVHTIKILRSGSDSENPEFEKDNPSFNFNTALYEANKSAVNTVAGDESATDVSIDDNGYVTKGGTTIPVTTGSADKKAPFDQGSTILTLPTMTVWDDKDTNLSISIKITDRKGNEVSKVNQEKVSFDSTTQTYTISDASFKLSGYGVYTVTYTAKDFSGKTTARSYGIRVNDKTAPTITLLDEDKFGKTIEVGEYFEVPTAQLIKDGETFNGTINWEIYNKSNGAECTLYSNGFIPTSEGTFFIRYTGVDEFGNVASLEDSLFTVTAKDTIAPTIDLDLTYRFPASTKFTKETGEDYMTIKIPVAFATDKNRGQVDVTYTVTGPNGTKPSVMDYEGDENSHVKYFKATSEGTYTIKYSAVDEAGNESTKTLTIAVGDCEKPTLAWVNKDKDLPTEVKLNETYVLNLNNMLTLSDNESDPTYLREKISISVTAPDGTTVTNQVANNEGYEWKFTQTGNHTLKIVVKDKVGNTNTYSYTINVPSEEAETKKVSPVLGTVLVVLSVVVLGGVVVYFVASSKKKSSKKSPKKSK